MGSNSPHLRDFEAEAAAIENKILRGEFSLALAPTIEELLSCDLPRPLRGRMQIALARVGQGVNSASEEADLFEAALENLAFGDDVRWSFLARSMAASSFFAAGRIAQSTSTAIETLADLEGQDLPVDTVAPVLTNLALMFAHLTAFDLSLDLLSRSVRLCREADYSAWAIAGFNVGSTGLIAYAVTKRASGERRDDWLETVQSTLAVVQQHGEEHQRVLIAGPLMARVFLLQNQVDPARGLLEEIDAYLAAGGQLLTVAVPELCHTKALLAIADGRDEVALEQIDRAYETYGDRSPVELAEMLALKADVLMRNDRFEEACRCLEQRGNDLSRTKQAYIGELATVLTDRAAQEARQRVLTQKVDSLSLEASIDGLTGLHTRRSLDRQVVSYHGDERLGAAVILDLDHFKTINDTYGHAAGDEVLRRVSLVIGRECRSESDFAARYGGEEFVVLSTLANEHDVGRFVERIRSQVAAIDCGDIMDRSVTVSIGAAIGPRASFRELLGVADERLYQAKSSGRNCVVGP